MNVSHENRFVYLAIPRTGSRWTFSSLQPYGLVGGGKRPEVATHRIGIPSGCEDYLILASVRHPLTRMASCWRWVLGNAAGWGATGAAAMESFEAFIRYIATGATGIRSQSVELGDIEPKLLRFEDYPHALSALPFVGRTPPGFRGGGADPHTPLTTRLVTDLWADDFERFGY